MSGVTTFHSAGGAAATLVLAAVLCGCASEDSLLPSDLEPGILEGEDLLTRRLVVGDRRLGPVTDMRAGKLDPAPGVELCIAGSGAALFTDLKGAVKASVVLQKERYPTYAHRIVDADGDGTCEFLHLTFDGVTLKDHSGKKLWSHDLRGGGDCAAADLDGDGKLEFALGSSAGFVELLNHKGELLWRTKVGATLDVEIARGPGPGLPLILCTSDNKIVHLNRAGKILSRRQTRYRGYFGAFSVARYPGHNSKERLLRFHKDNICVMSLSGKTLVETLPSPSGYLPPLKTTPVRFQEDKPPYSAASGRYLCQGGRMFGLRATITVLYVFDSSGALVYHEVFESKEGGNAVLAIPDGASGREKLLVGGDGKVWEYTLTE